MSSKKIIIPKGLVDHPEQNSVIEVSSRLNESKGDLIAKRQGKKLVAQELPNWQDALSSPAVGNSNNTFVATPVGCRSSNRNDATFRSARNKTFYQDVRSTPGPMNNTTFYSQNVTDSTNYQSAFSGDSTFPSMRTCYNSSPGQTPSRARLNITGNNLTVNSTIESNIQMTDPMLSNILSETRENLGSPQTDESSGSFQLRKRPLQRFDETYEPNQTNFRGQYSSIQSRPNETYPQTATRHRLPEETWTDSQHQHSSDECPCSLRQSNYTETFDIPVTSSTRAAHHTYVGNTTRVRDSSIHTPCASRRFYPMPTNQTFAGAPNQTNAETQPTFRTPHTVPRASTRSRRPRLGQDTFPRSANRNVLEAESCSAECASRNPSGLREYPTDESYDANFQPFLSSTQRSLSTMEDSSDEILFGFGGPLSRSQDGKYNNIVGWPQATEKIDLTGPRPGATQTFVGRGPQGLSTTVPSASSRSRRPRPGEETYPRSANRSTLESSSCAPSCPTQEFSGIRVHPTSESYAIMDRTQAIKRNDLTCPRPTPAQTFVGRGPQGLSSTMPRASSRNRRLRPDEATYPRSANRSVLEAEESSFDSNCAPGCPSQESSSIREHATDAIMNRTQAIKRNDLTGPRPAPQSLSSTMPRASSRSRRPRLGEDTYPRSANRSVLESSADSSCAPSCPSQESSGIREYPTDESYDFDFRPWQSSTQRSWSTMEDSSEEGFYGFGAPLSRSQDGKYNNIVGWPQATNANNLTCPRPAAAETFVNSPGRTRGSQGLSTTIPRAFSRSRRPRHGEDTYPRSANRSDLEAEESSADSNCAPNCPSQGSSGIREYPTDESYLIATERNDLTCPRPAPAQTFIGSPARGLQGLSSTMPRASSRSRRPRPGEDTYPRSANRSVLEAADDSSPSQETSGIREHPTDESYDYQFRPWHSSTQRSWSTMEDSSGGYVSNFEGSFRKSQMGKYNVITPMTPSPEKPADECACAPEGPESLVSYSSRVVVDEREES